MEPVPTQHLAEANIAVIFEKASTRTRCAFEVAAHHQGAHVTYLDPSGSHMGHKESAKDSARVLGRMFDAIEYRGFSQATVETLAAARRRTGVERPDRRVAPHPVAVRHAHDARARPQARPARSPSPTSVTPTTTSPTRCSSPAR